MCLCVFNLLARSKGFCSVLSPDDDQETGSVSRSANSPPSGPLLLKVTDSKPEQVTVYHHRGQPRAECVRVYASIRAYKFVSSTFGPEKF